MPEATFDPNWGSMPGGWLPEYTNGVLTGWWRNTALDPSRGANQQGVQAGTDYGFEYVPADKINGGEPATGDIEYRTGGTSIEQNKPRGGALLEKVVPLALAAIAGGGALSAAGLGPYAGAVQADMGLLGAAPAASSSTGGSFLSDLVGQSFANPDVAMGAAQSAAPSFMAESAGLATAPMSLAPYLGTSTAGLGALGSAAGGALGAAANAVTPADYEIPPDWKPPAGTTASEIANAVGNTAGNASGLLSNVPDWLKQWGPLLGGLALGAESYLNKGDEQPQDPFTRDWARGLLSNPRASAGAMSGLMNKKYY